MFGIKKSEKGSGKAAKLAGPGPIPAPVQSNLVSAWKMAPDIAPLFVAVMKRPDSGGAASIRIFDAADAAARKVEVKDYLSLDAHPEMVAYEGTYDEATKAVHLAERNKPVTEVPIPTESEIRAKVEALADPGSTVFFYLCRGSGHGGPAAMGAAVIELNPAFPGKGQKKYNVRVSDVIDMKPVDLGEKLWSTDKVKDVARWVKDGQGRRLYSS